MPGASAQDFVEAESVPVGLYPSYPLVADLDGDGDGDIVASNLNSQGLDLLLGDGAGDFAISTLAAGGHPWDVDAADMNGDGLLDLVATNASPPAIAVLLGDGLGHRKRARSSPIARHPK